MGFILVCGLHWNHQRADKITILPPATHSMALRLQCLKPKAHNYSVLPDWGVGSLYYSNSRKSQLLFLLAGCMFLMPDLGFSGGTGQDWAGLGWADLGWWGSKGWMSINSGSWLRVTQALTLLPWWQALNLILVSANSHPECFSNLIEGKSTVSSSFGFEKVFTLVLIREYYLLCMHFPLFMWQRRGLV